MDSKSFGSCVYNFLTSIKFQVALPPGIEILNPYRNTEVLRIVETFCKIYYKGQTPRIPVWGINPGRFGAGVTGLSFTDPFALNHQLGISTTLQGKRELSAEFIGMVIDAFGGAHTFYRHFYLSALSPVGFIKQGKNINFYDDGNLKQNIVSFVIESVKQQQACGLAADRAIVLGTGILRQFVERTLKPELPYKEIHYLEHPRFIMQYRRQKLTEYIRKYTDLLERFV